MPRLAAIASILVVLAGCASDPSADLAEGDRLVVEGQAAEALDAYRRAAEADPEDRRARFRIARTLLALDRVDEGVVALGEAVDASPDGRPSAVADAGRILIEAGHPTRSMRFLDERGPADDAQLLVVRGQAELRLGRIAEAVESFERAGRLAADSKTLAHLGTACYLAGLQEVARAGRETEPARRQAAARRAADLMNRAREALQEALYLDPDDPAVHLSLGQLHHQAGRFDEALLEYRWADRLAPEAPEPLLLAGGVHYERGEYEEAVAALVEAGQRGAGGRAAFFLGMAYWRMEKGAESLGAFESATRAHPELERQILAWFDRDRRENLPALIRLLEEGQPEVAAESHRLLRGLSGQEFEADPARWRAWWESDGQR